MGEVVKLPSRKRVARPPQSALSARTRFSAEDIGGVFKTEAGLGVKPGDMPYMTRQIRDIATGSGESLAQTFKTHLGILRQFSLPLTAMPHISDTLARIHTKTGISLGQLGTQFGQTGAVAHKVGMSEEETAAALGYLTKKGMGQYAGTGLAQMLGLTLAPNAKQAALWENLGIHREDLIDQKTGNMKALNDVLDILREHMKGMRPADQAAFLKKAYGARAWKVASALLDDDKGELRALTKDLEGIKDFAKTMGVEGSQGGAAGVARLAASIKNLHDAIGESGFGDQVGWVANKLGGLLDRISGGSNGMKETAGWIAALGNALSSMAMPLMAANILLPLLGRITGLNAVARGLWAIVAPARALQALTGLGAVAAAIAYLRSQHTPEGAKHEYDAMKSEGAKNDAIISGVVNWLRGNGYVQNAPPGPQGAGYLPGFSDAVNKLMASGAAQQIIVKVDAPHAVDLNVTVTGAGLQSGTAQGQLPLSATSPRGTTMNVPPSPPVAR